MPPVPPVDPVHAAIPPTTTEQQNLTVAGQRRINLIWEYTQAMVALIVVLANVTAWVVASLTKKSSPIPEGMQNALFLIVGFYFSRTNHAAIGGIGPKASDSEYRGR